MAIKTSDSYQKEVLKKYKEDKGGAMMSGYLINPTRSSIRDACLWLLDRRKEKTDEYILNRFFQFKEGEDKERHIQGLKSEKADKFVPVINFLKGRVQKTSPENIELISWLIDFKPRPCQEYLKSDNLVSEVNDSKTEIMHEPEGSDISNVDKLEEKKELERKNLEEAKREEEKKRRRHIITISISVVFGMTLLILGIQNRPFNILKSNTSVGECMTWTDSLYITVSCDEAPLSAYGNEVKPLDKTALKKMHKVEVDIGFKFFSDTGEPLIWYAKNKNGKHEYFTAPGLHPVTGKTLRKITPHIIQKYVPFHSNNKRSFKKGNVTNSPIK